MELYKHNKFKYLLLGGGDSDEYNDDKHGSVVYDICWIVSNRDYEPKMFEDNKLLFDSLAEMKKNAQSKFKHIYERIHETETRKKLYEIFKCIPVLSKYVAALVGSYIKGYEKESVRYYSTLHELIGAINTYNKRIDCCEQTVVKSIETMRDCKIILASHESDGLENVRMGEQQSTNQPSKVRFLFKGGKDWKSKCEMKSLLGKKLCTEAGWKAKFKEFLEHQKKIYQNALIKYDMAKQLDDLSGPGGSTDGTDMVNVLCGSENNMVIGTINEISCAITALYSNTRDLREWTTENKLYFNLGYNNCGDPSDCMGNLIITQAITRLKMTVGEHAKGLDDFVGVMDKLQELVGTDTNMLEFAKSTMRAHVIKGLNYATEETRTKNVGLLDKRISVILKILNNRDLIEQMKQTAKQVSSGWNGIHKSLKSLNGSNFLGKDIDKINVTMVK